MTPDSTATPAETPAPPPSTAGMTTKVVKGSIWTLAGQVAPMAVSLIATPFVIRMLGSEAYGVLILIGLIPAYFSFADFGMGVASTKFGAVAYGDSDLLREGDVVRTASLLCIVFSTLVLLPTFVFSNQIVEFLDVPIDLRSEAGLALKLSTAAFALGLLTSVLNTPQLVRLRMDLNTISSTVPKIFLGLATPIVLFWGGGIFEVVWASLAAAILMIVLNIYYSSRLHGELFRASIDSTLIRPLIVVGGGWFFAGIAATLLVNFEKLLLAKLVSVQSLAFYSVAFTFAGMTTMFSIAMRQSMVPAFSQLTGRERRQEFELLFDRGVRLTLIILIPAIATLFVIARPFFTFWAGEEFGRESTFPFYILVCGLFFNVLAYLPHSAIMGFGRTDVFAKLYWIELAVYIFGATALIYFLGIIGAAIAWSLRVIIDAIVVIWIAKRIVGISFRFADHFKDLKWAVLILIPPIIIAAIDGFFIGLVFLFPLCLAIYAVYIWRVFAAEAEKMWIRSKLLGLTGRFGIS